MLPQSGLHLSGPTAQGAVQIRIVNVEDFDAGDGVTPKAMGRLVLRFHDLSILQRR